jgi:hypothetical protein
MANTAALTGRATIFGFIGDVSFSGIGTLFKESGEFEDDFVLDEVTDDLNDPTTLIGSKRVYNAKLMFTPMAASGGSGGTNTLASAASSLAAPAMLAPVTLTNFKWCTANSANWVYVGGWKIAFKKNGVATYEMNIRMGVANNLAVQRLDIS